MPDRPLPPKPPAATPPAAPDTLALGEISLAELGAPIATLTYAPAGATGPVASAGAPAGPADTLRIAPYELREKIGEGGMGEVWRAWDPVLQRTVAVKLLRPEAARKINYLIRFIEEARATGGLQHPGIVPVHDLFRLPDGRPGYAMREVEGRTLEEAIAAAHAQGPAPTESLPIQRLLRAFEQACRAVAYAHAHQVVHRDLKPQNIMLGPFGEVYVLDWGLARPLHRVDAADPDDDDSVGPAWHTRRGAVVGTPAYMAPEQADPRRQPLSLATDVYALGAVLYEILTGRPPVRAPDVSELLERVIAGRIEPIPTPLGVPVELAGLCMRALSLDPGARPSEAGTLAEDLEAILEGQSRRAAAVLAVEEADALLPQMEQLRAQARALAESARDRLAAVSPSGPVEARRKVWAVEDEAQRLRRDAEVLSVRYVQGLQGALATFAELPEALDRLAEYHRYRLVEATSARDAEAAARHETLLRVYDRGRYADWLAGRGALTLLTDPPGARVTLHRFVNEGRRLVPRLERQLGHTPLREVDVPPGSWLLMIEAPGRPPVAYPVEIGGDALWDGVPPGESEPFPIPIPREDEVPAGVVYVPPGPARVGGDLRAGMALPAGRPWVGGFLVHRQPVENGAWLDLVNDLAMGGEAERAAAVAPRPPVGATLVYDWTATLPVRFVDAAAADAYAAWYAARHGAGWRLVGDVEWEKAARGVDGRAFPWGDFLDPHWCNMRESRVGAPAVAPVDAWTDDVGVYGVRGAAGNVRTWTSTPGPRPGTRLVRGGWFGAAADDCRAAARAVEPVDLRDPGIGVRLARAWPGG